MHHGIRRPGSKHIQLDSLQTDLARVLTGLLNHFKVVKLKLSKEEMPTAEAAQQFSIIKHLDGSVTVEMLGRYDRK